MSCSVSAASFSRPMSMTTSQTDFALSLAIEAGFRLSQEEILQIFNAKCKDFHLKYTDKLYTRFKRTLLEKPFQKIFWIDSSSLGSESASTIAKILSYHAHFKILQLSSNDFGDRGAEEISKVIYFTKSLIHVDVSANGIKDKGLASIFNAMRYNNTIVCLNVNSKPGVSRNSFGLNAAKEMSDMLEENKILTELDASMAEITSDAITIVSEGLAHNRFLMEFNISNNNIQSKGVFSLLPSVLPTNIKVLKLAANHLKDDCGVEFASFFEGNKNLEVLDLSHNDLTSKFIAVIAASLGECQTLKEINFSKNPLTGKGAAILGRVLSQNPSLQILSLQACKIDHNGAIAFSDSFKLNKKLKSLNLSNNPLRDDGIQALGMAIGIQASLSKLFIELVEMSDKSSANFFEAIAKTDPLRSISIRNNLIKDGIPLLRYIEQSKSIRHFSLEYNDISYKTIECIASTLDSKNKKRIAEKKMPHDEKQMTFAELEAELIEVRYTIKKQRDILEALKKGVVVSRDESKEAFRSKTETVSTLETRDKELETIIRNENMCNRNTIDALTNSVAAEKIYVERVETEMLHEIHKFKNDVEIIANIDRQMEELKAKHLQEMEDLKFKMKETIQNYKYNIMDLEEAFRYAKNGPLPPVAQSPIENVESAKKSRRKRKMTKSSKKGRKSKKSLPASAKNEEETPERQPVLIVDAQNPTNKQ